MKNEYPKGYIVAVGGAEEKGTENEKDGVNPHFFELGILKHIVDLVKKTGEPAIEVITTASSDPEDVFETYKLAFQKLGVKSVHHMDIRSRNAANDAKNLKRLKACNCILFSGGDQLRLSSIFGGTSFVDILKERYKNEAFVIAGTSAGAMVMSNPMIYEGRADKANLKGEVKIVSGLGLVQEVIIDTHVDKRGRFSRLAQAVAAQPGAVGIGLGEDTGVIVKKGWHMQAIGSSSIIIIDGRELTCTNIAEISLGMPITVQNLKVHIMAAGDAYDIHTRSFESLEA